MNGTTAELMGLLFVDQRTEWKIGNKLSSIVNSVVGLVNEKVHNLSFTRPKSLPPKNLKKKTAEIGKTNKYSDHVLELL